MHRFAGAKGSVPSRDTSPPADEAQLAHRLAAGDPDALSLIVDWLWNPLASYAYRLVEDRDAAMDIAQEACVRLWKGRGRTQPKSLRSYLYRITRNLALDYLKTRRTRFRLLSSHTERGAHTAAPDEVLERERVSASVHTAIQELPQKRREVFTLAYLRGLSYAEIAEVMEISPKTVQNHMTAALSQLRNTLRQVFDDEGRHSAEKDYRDE